MIVLVTGVGGAAGSRAAAAALACAAAEADRTALLIDLAEGRPPRPTPVATGAARELEERLAAHLPDAGVASRGRICQLAPPDDGSTEGIAAALPLVRETAAVVHLPPGRLQPLLDEPSLRPAATLLRADLPADRSLTALAAGDLVERGIRVAVLKRPLGWLSARAALLGALPPSGSALPAHVRKRLLGAADSKFHRCYDRKDGLEDEQRQVAREQDARQEPPRPGTREGAPQGRR